ncbi:hypothetical protein AAFC00_003483 [Neodothiora populina]|uniref:Uncharacterized protein n=1 Tax=Neodothiora populina TaxID=2781224 RepID=A0ABR3PED7_9PEZI
MYGFHKKVGLNANSMKAAEKKVKDPNVYWHEYFKRGRPDLLWLIQKPQSKTNAAKRKRNEHDKRDPNDSEDDVRRTSPELVDSSHVTKPQRAGQGELMVSIPQSELHNVRSELQKLQRQQGVISKMISQLKEQNEQFYRQATAFQALHDRHENSINAILTFLATFYNRSLDGQNPQNLVNMFQNSVQQNQHQGSVVDVGDLPEANIDNNQQLQRYPKRPLALLPPPHTGSTPSTNPASARSSMSPSMRQRSNLSVPSALPPQQHQQQAQQPQQQQQQRQAPRASSTPHVKNDAETPNYLSQLPEDDMISLLNNVNASNSASPNLPGGSNFDFSSALDHFQTANGASPLTQQQRDSMLSLIAQQGQPSTSRPGANNALVAPTPPPMPSLDQLARTQEQLDMLTRLQQDQDSKVADLAGRLQPLSPSGTIPGMGGPGDPGDFDINAFINSDDNYFNQFPSTGGSTNVTGGDMSNTAQSGTARMGTADDELGGGGAGDIDFSNLGDASTWNFDAGGNALSGDTDDLFGEYGTSGGDDDTTSNAAGVGGGGVGSGAASSADISDSRAEDDMRDGRGRIVGSVTSEETSPAAAGFSAGDDLASVAAAGEGGGIAQSVEGDTPGKKRKVQR